MRTRVKISLIDIAISLTRFLTIQLSNVGDFRSVTTIGMLSPKSTYQTSPNWLPEMWSGLDAYIGLIIACLPALRPYLRKKGPKYDYSESGRPTAHSNIPPRQAGQNGFEEIDETPSLEGDSGPGIWDGSSSADARAGWSDKESTRSDVELVSLDADSRTRTR
ncbi:hypothetical protein ACHAPU_001248 [Fusarium lateritium]